MNNSKNVVKEIKGITDLLISQGLSINQNYPVEKRERDGSESVEWNNVTNLSISLKNIEYKEIYDELDKNRDYSIKLIDGALIHMMYKFNNNKVISHRLAFYSSPYLENYQENPEMYEEDEIYADIIYKNIVAFPIRFDYNEEEVEAEYPHPRSHATLGQYKNCRIPVVGPISPKVFIEFIFKNFYGTVYYKLLNNKFKGYCKSFKTITKEEINELHFSLPIDESK